MFTAPESKKTFLSWTLSPGGRKLQVINSLLVLVPPGSESLWHHILPPSSPTLPRIICSWLFLEYAGTFLVPWPFPLLEYSSPQVVISLAHVLASHKYYFFNETSSATLLKTEIPPPLMCPILLSGPTLFLAPTTNHYTMFSFSLLVFYRFLSYRLHKGRDFCWFYSLKQCIAHANVHCIYVEWMKR